MQPRFLTYGNLRYERAKGLSCRCHKGPCATLTMRRSTKATASGGGAPKEDTSLPNTVARSSIPAESATLCRRIFFKSSARPPGVF